MKKGGGNNAMAANKNFITIFSECPGMGNVQEQRRLLAAVVSGSDSSYPSFLTRGTE